jgi:exosortase E/protease (VPEID-CTERM system)
LFEPTAALSKYFLGVMGYKVFIDENIFKIYVDNFSGEIAASCLGYQGASLGLLFLCGYLYVMRKDFRFPQALVVLPLAVLALWLLNSVRIALLLAVGSSWSEDIATNGFHRVGGWINLIGVSSLMLFILHRTSWLSTVNRQNLTLSVNKENIKLLPQLTLIATTILSLLFTGQFDWLYPVRILIVGFVLIYTCKKTNFKLMRPDFVTVLLGLFIFIVWMMLVPSFPEKDAEFSNAISKAPDMLFYVWIFFRVVGAVVVVPLSEELAFRGFVVDRLKSQLSPSVGVNIHHFLIGLISSVAFGLLHEAWVAGIIAGLVFYYAINRRSQISDAVVVHAIVNLLISIYVLTTHEWSYW